MCPPQWLDTVRPSVLSGAAESGTLELSLVPMERWHPWRCVFGKAVADKHEGEQHGSEVHREQCLNGKRVSIDDREVLLVLTKDPSACPTEPRFASGIEHTPVVLPVDAIDPVRRAGNGYLAPRSSRR